VEEALAAGCDQIIMITGRGKSAIEDHFDARTRTRRAHRARIDWRRTLCHPARR
jgi:UTP-glucose-1-phosphate uridylyltransferase